MYIPHVTATDHCAGFRIYHAKTQNDLPISDVLLNGLVSKLAANGFYSATSEPPHGNHTFALTTSETDELRRGLQAASLRSRVAMA